MTEQAKKTTVVPLNAKKPQDRTAKADVRKEDTVLEYGGETYTIPADTMDNIEIIEFIEDEEYIHAIRAIIGREQWSKFKDAHRDERGRVSTEDFQAFIEYVFGSLGN